MNPTRAFATAAVALFATGAFMAAAEPITPPAGPVAPTGATQILSVPFTINQPGSYRLARDFSFSAGTAINIIVDDVVLDLGGHSLSGGGVGATAIQLNAGSSITVRNGSIENCLGSAIIASGAGSPVTIENMQFRNLGQNAIAVFLSTAFIRNCIVEDVGLNAVAAGNGSVVENVTIRTAAVDGLVVADNVTVRNSHVFDAGSQGFRANSDCVFEGCTASGNGIGFSTGAGTVIENATAEANAQIGVLTGANSIVRGVVARTNGFGPVALAVSPPRVDSPTPEGLAPIVPDDDLVPTAPVEIDPRTGESVGGIAALSPTSGNDGIRVGGGSVVADCVASGNAEDGIAAGDFSRVIDCVSRSNNGVGVFVGADCQVTGSLAGSNGSDGIAGGVDLVVRDCTADNNGANGFSVSDDATVFGCKAEANGGDGIHNVGTGTIIEGCHVAANTGDGIESTTSIVVIVRNTLELDNINTPVGSTRVGPINDLTSPWANWSM